jgi:hypothetical protein
MYEEKLYALNLFQPLYFYVSPHVYISEGLSIISMTGAAICTADIRVVAQWNGRW